MKFKIRYPVLVPVYALVLCVVLLIAWLGNNFATVLAENEIMHNRKTVVIDPGHGGIDGGATSCSGLTESRFNLEIALKLRDIMHLLGLRTIMIRTEDISVYTEGTTIAAQKMSDLKQRVKIVNEAENAILVSIHQNTFSDSRYHGAQVFYAATPGSEAIAKDIQNAIHQTLDLNNNRRIKPSKGVYLMEKIQCSGVLIECGFLSNPEEEGKLRSDSYQKQLCCVIAAVVNGYLHGNSTA